MFSPEKLKNLIIEKYPQALVSVIDLVGDNNHFEASIITPEFEGKSMVEQHQLINDIFRDFLLSGELHALSLKTYPPSKRSLL